MRFALIDQIVEFELGKKITAVKSPTLSEEYLQDHFPLFPVMPGVLMLEAMYQASAWLLRKTDDFAFSMVSLEEARTVKYAGFVRPGQTLQVTCNLHKRDGASASFKAKGAVNERVVVSARLLLNQYNLAEENPARQATDIHICRHMRREFESLCRSMTAMNAPT